MDRNIWFPIKWNGQSWAGQYEGAFLESLDTLDESSMLSLFKTFDYTRGTRPIIPSDTITIGDASGGAVLLGIGRDNYGKVFFWAQDQMPVQDSYTPDYDNVGLVSSDFDAFHWSQIYFLLCCELARKKSQNAFSSIVPAASSRTACAAASSLAVN